MTSAAASFFTTNDHRWYIPEQKQNEPPHLQ